ncbi:uncharacterized protein PHALS_14554 [Plasmopara halstedii]|uniref:Uncharacterized protein n=1 Tax=Plasmopara halstedii TaxID=4781 RepID=A0A0P1ALB6_PLAHL|nr:uncharacterized protein PHALS_14554 [Plasmopara halstedii]CEG41672.1 hypothetical protein PHALS_14554 [Plasmopara halstedii]|eukprot:XP_024578041.1 hypothetical protein PHALS_14554 [Plasmopara halstedii]
MYLKKIANQSEHYAHVTNFTCCPHLCQVLYSCTAAASTEEQLTFIIYKANYWSHLKASLKRHAMQTEHAFIDVSSKIKQNSGSKKEIAHPFCQRFQI